MELQEAPNTKMIKITSVPGVLPVHFSQRVLLKMLGVDDPDGDIRRAHQGSTIYLSNKEGW